MPKKKTEVSSKRSDRTNIIFEREKEKRSPEKFTQKMFSDLANISQQNLSSIINKKMALTEGTAEAIINAFPESGYRIEWLLGYDDDMTEADKFKRTIQETQNEGTLLENGIKSFLNLNGYELVINRPKDNTIESIVKNLNRLYTITNHEKEITLGHKEFNLFANKISDYVDFELRHMMNSIKSD